MHHRYPKGMNSYLSVIKKNVFYIFQQHGIIHSKDVNNDAINTKCYYHEIITAGDPTEPDHLAKSPSMKSWNPFG
jgi:hypothetical protein